MFHPTRLRKMLRELALGHRLDAPGMIKEDGARTGRALVQGEDELVHG